MVVEIVNVIFRVVMLICASFVLCYTLRDIVLMIKWKKEPLHNFPFYWRGKNYWYSRACAVVLFTYCKDALGNVYVLANKRGSGTPDFQGCWNAPCGYLDFNEDGKQAAIRETKEETGVEIPYDKVKLIEVSSSPSQNLQNVTLRHACMLDGTIDDYKFSTDDMEENEVEDIQWIRVDGEYMNNFEWAFGHYNLIKNIYNKVVNGAEDCSATIEN